MDARHAVAGPHDTRGTVHGGRACSGLPILVDVGLLLRGAASVCFVFCSGAAMAADCAALLREHLRTDLALPFEAFDQDDEGGWRRLAAADCDAESAQLIEAYIAGQAQPHPVLRWHAAQALARAGDSTRAIEVARQTRRPQAAEADSEFQWNAYVDATVAFLQGDREALEAHRRQLAAASARSALNRPNLASVERLQRCFGQPYKQAYRCREGQ